MAACSTGPPAYTSSSLYSTISSESALLLLFGSVLLVLVSKLPMGPAPSKFQIYSLFLLIYTSKTILFKEVESQVL
jgi:hypothetical protein